MAKGLLCYIGGNKMIIVFKPRATENDVNRIIAKVERMGLKTHLSKGEMSTIVGLVGDTTRVDPKQFEVDECVERIMKVSEPYKLANRAFHPEDSIIDVSGVKVGGNNLTLIAGPCSVESKEQVIEIARSIKKSGAHMLRGGAYKPRTSPYSFQGMGTQGLDILVAAKEETGLPIVSELMGEKYIDEFNDKVDLVQIGARNMQNFDLLKEVGRRIKKPVLLKRGLSNIDPSHAGGKWWLVDPMAKAAVVAGADGLMIEVHNDPECALCDGPQSLKPEKYDDLIQDIKQIIKITDKTL